MKSAWTLRRDNSTESDVRLEAQGMWCYKENRKELWVDGTSSTGQESAGSGGEAGTADARTRMVFTMCGVTRVLVLKCCADEVSPVTTLPKDDRQMLHVRQPRVVTNRDGRDQVLAKGRVT